MTSTVRLSDLCDLVTQQVDPAQVDKRCPYLGLEHLASGRLRAVGQGQAADVQSHKFLYQAGDVLYGKLRPYLDKAVLAETPGVCTTELLVLRAREGVDARFLGCVVHAPDFIDHAMSGVTGAHHPRTSWAQIADFELPRFNAAQQRVVAGLLWHVQDLLDSCEQSEVVAQQLKRAAMREIFARGLRGASQKETEFGPVPETWGIHPLETIAFVQTGVAKGRKLNPAEAIDVPYLRVANVQDGHLDLREIKNIRIRSSEIERYLLREGDVVLTEGGDFDKLGRGFIWRDEVAQCIHQNHVFAVRVNRERLLPEFLAYVAQSTYGRAYFLKVAHKTTNLACINTTKLKAFPVLVPDTTEQGEIVAILEAVDHQIDLHKKKSVVLQHIFKALLRKLMSGEMSVDGQRLFALEGVNSASKVIAA